MAFTTEAVFYAI